MRILFIENREKTRFWSAIAAQLEANGHTVAWAVQNPMFADGLPGRVFIMPFPRPTGAVSPWNPEEWPLLVTDRGRQYFGSGHAHYSHYEAQYRSILDDFQPQLVLGEATLFHELLAVAEARRRAIPYFHPSAERYPQDRFCFFHDVTQEAYAGEGYQYPDGEALDYAQRVAEGREALVYMRKRGRIGLMLRKLEWAWTRGRVFLARLRGERYNTPGPALKWRLERQVKHRLAQWHAIERPVDPGDRAILYPMQMAPEANIDVWGRPFNDQVDVMRRILAAAPENVKLAIKCNPKPKYEMSDELLAFARSEPRVILLPAAMRMPDAMAQCVGAITICGTVGFEAVFGRGRCISLRHPVIAENCPDHAAETPEDAVRKLLDEPGSGLGSPALGARLLQAIAHRSYPGYISDPFSSPACLAPENVAKVARGVEQLVAHIERAKVSGASPL